MPILRVGDVSNERFVPVSTDEVALSLGPGVLTTMAMNCVAMVLHGEKIGYLAHISPAFNAARILIEMCGKLRIEKGIAPKKMGFLICGGSNRKGHFKVENTDKDEKRPLSEEINEALSHCQIGGPVYDCMATLRGGPIVSPVGLTIKKQRADIVHYLPSAGFFQAFSIADTPTTEVTSARNVTVVTAGSFIGSAPPSP